MTDRFTKLVVSVLLTFGASCVPAERKATPPALPSVALPPDLERVLRDFERNWRSRSSPSFAELFSPDGFVLPDNGLPVRGRTSVAHAYDGADTSLSLRAVSYSTSDTVGYIIGMFSPLAGQQDVGKFVIALRRDQGGPGQVAAAIDNSNRD